MTDELDRRDARTVETVLALGLGVATFLGLVLLGVGVDHLLRATTSLSLAPVAPGLAVAAAVVSGAVVVAVLLRARRRGL